MSNNNSGKVELKEKLAAIEHERWSDWQKWVHAVYENPTRPFEEAIANWKKQIDTPYEKLSDREKASDMEQVDRYWSLVEAYISSKVNEADLRARQDELEQFLVDEGWSADSEISLVQISGKPTHRRVADRLMKIHDRIRTLKEAKLDQLSKEIE